MAELRYYGTADFFEHPLLVAVTATCDSAYDLFEHQYVFDLGDIRHHDLACAKVFYLMLVAPVAVDDPVRVEVMECGEVVECAGCLDNFVAAAERLDGVFREHERIELCIDRMDAIALDEEHRLARSDDSHVKLIGHSFLGGEQRVVPCHGCSVIVADPDDGGVVERRGKFKIVGGVDERAVGAQ